MRWHAFSDLPHSPCPASASPPLPISILQVVQLQEGASPFPAPVALKMKQTALKASTLHPFPIEVEGVVEGDSTPEGQRSLPFPRSASKLRASMGSSMLPVSA